MSAPASTDAELLAAAGSGDRAAFDRLAARHQRQLWGVALRTLRHREDAADAVQDTLVAAFRHAASYRGEASVRTWLHRIVVRECLDRIRDAQRRPTVPLGEHPSRRVDVAAEVATRMDLVEALATIPTEQRLAVVLVDVQGWLVTEAAEVLEVPVGTVKSRCARGRTRLAVLLGHLREEEA